MSSKEGFNSGVEGVSASAGRGVIGVSRERQSR
jgi:hypothetical protein